MAMSDRKIVYVTGCAGFIGSYVAETCLQQGWYVYGVDKMTYASDEKVIDRLNQYSNFTFEQIDINDIDFLYDCDYIINCAAETHVGNSIVDSDEFVHSNIKGVHHLLELVRSFRAENARKPVLLHFSTDEVYGDIIDGKHKETDPLRPSNPYSATKAAADMLIKAWHRTYDIPYIIVRPTNNYGVGQYVEKLIPKAVKYLQLGRQIPLHNKGEPTRNWLHAGDTAGAIVTIINSGVVNEIYNIDGGFEQSNKETVKKIIAAYNKRTPSKENVKYSEVTDLSIHRPGQDVRYAIDDSKLRKLGWLPTRDFDKEIDKIVSYNMRNFRW